MRTNLLNKGMKYSLMFVMFFITYAMAFAQPDPDSSQYNRNHLMKFMIEANSEFTMDYSFAKSYFAYEGVDTTSADFYYELLLECPLNTPTIAPTNVNLSQDGIVHWTPTTPGRYYFGIRVFMSDIPEESLVIGNLITVAPTAAQKCATITGQVTLPTNLDSNIYLPGFKMLQVMALPLEQTTYTEPYYGDVTANGRYRIKVPVGSYKLAFSYMDAYKFYPNATDYESAQIITVACGDTVVANMNITAQDFPDRVYFTTYPPLNVELNVNEVYNNYQANAVSTLGNQVFYRIYNEDADPYVTATIDANNGMVSFSSSHPGRHYVKLEAYVAGDSGPRVKQFIEFFVRGEEPVDPTLCAFIVGTVSGLNNPVDSNYIDGTVYAMPTMTGDSLQYDPNWAKRSYMTEINSNGYYALYLPAGSYKLYFYANGYKPEFYNNALDYESAQTITINCGDTLTINAELDVYVPPTMYTLSGRVHNLTSNEGIRAHIRLFLNNDFADSTYNKEFRNSITIENNQDGTYSIELPEGTSFKAYAIPMKQNLYLGEYYNDTYNVEEAELITLTANRSGVDFGLARRSADSTSKFHINGYVKDQTGTPVLSMLTLIRKPAENESENNYTFTNMPTDALGYYDFTHVKEGNYLLFAMPVNRPLLPGFYVNSGIATWNWEEATEIAVPGANGQMPAVLYDVTLPNIVDTLGLGKVSGKIEQSLGKIATFAKLGNGSGISGVMVTAYDANSVPVKYVYTNENGEFNFDKLGFGDFTLKASKIGYGSKSTIVTIDAQNLTTNSNIYMDTKSNEPTSVEETAKSAISINPNPVQNSTTLNFEGNEGNATITISDMQGREMITIYNTLVNGANSVVINASELNSGLYLVKVRGNNTNIQTLMNVVK